MLRFLTNKLKSQTLNEVRPAIQENDDDHDSGTESDDENPENKDINQGFGEKSPYDTCGSGSTSAVCSSSSPVGRHHSGQDSGVMQEISDQNYDSLSCTSDYERQSLDFERHSSEEELAVINKENVAEKRKWSQTQCSGCGGDSAGSSDDEVKEFLLNPQPVLLSSSPPKGIKKISSHSPAPKLLLARVTPLSVSSVSPRKRHRQTTTSDSLSDSSVIQRPCLDFEKMQQVNGGMCMFVRIVDPICLEMEEVLV
ncbi:hypothetical protein ACJMK2_035821 [Sinanodonta woodiana]|uniref:Uncharacterized protein n=1 Tax=Sinanodonta woodiana TaxID=1069815 RepID=A0ABD3WGV6_SINWO